MFIDDDFHFIDARFEEKHFAGKNRGAGIFQADDGVEGPVHSAFDSARHGNEIIHQRIVEHHFRKSGGLRP